MVLVSYFEKMIKTYDLKISSTLKGIFISHRLLIYDSISLFVFFQYRVKISGL